jgi:hypothetical protein
MKTELSIIKYNLTAISGWAIVALSLVGMVLHNVFQNNSHGWLFGVVGVAFGLVLIKFSGPIKIVQTKLVNLQPVDLDTV